MPGGITLLAALPSSIPTPPANKVTIFFNLTTGQPYYKDSSGALYPLGTVGAPGIPGMVGIDGDDGSDGLLGARGPTGLTGPSGPSGSIFFIGADGEESENLVIGYPSSQVSAASGSVWSLAGSNSPTTQSQVDFTGLAGATDIRVLIVGMTTSQAAEFRLQVSIDNGSTFLSASGDYVGVAGSGSLTNTTSFAFNDQTGTVARSGEISIAGANLTSPKVARATFFATNSINLMYAPTANAINAVRVLTTAGTMSAGTIYVFKR